MPVSRVIIDWNDASSGPAAADIARTEYLLLHAGPPDEEIPDEIQRMRLPLTEAYRAGYRSVRAYDTELVDAWRLPVLVRRMRENVEQERERLRRLLAEELA